MISIELIRIPIHVGFQKENDDFTFYSIIVFVLEILISFNISDFQEGILNKDRKKIMKRYMFIKSKLKYLIYTILS